MSEFLDRLVAVLASRYELERQLGEGMATVYLARGLKHGRRVAIKVLRPALAVRLGSGRFLQEIKVTAPYAGADHPNYDVHPDGKRFVIVTGRARPQPQRQPQPMTVAINQFPAAAARR